ncbi:hypothetical protein ACTXT7_009349 [Hymenolepis weldensis]
MPDPSLQKQPQVSLKNLAGKSCITHHILPIFSYTNRLSSFQEFTESFDGTKAYFKSHIHKIIKHRLMQQIEPNNGDGMQTLISLNVSLNQ